MCSSDENGPNNTRRVVWVIGVSFFLCYLLIVTIDF